MTDTPISLPLTREIGSHVGGPQTFLGPTLAIPYTVPAQATPEHGTYWVFPVQGRATIKTRTEERRRSLFKVPVFEANPLLVGAIASFLAVAAAMHFTRGIDWYSQLARSGTQEQQASLLVPKDPA